MDQTKIGAFITLCRKDKKMTQEQLAEKLNVSVNAVSKWERGLNLPDYSNMQILCDTLDISINEFFAGEHLQDNEVEKQAERNILDILKISSAKNKKSKLLILIICILSIILVFIIGRYFLIKYGFIIDDDLKYSQVYIIGESNNKGNVDINKYVKDISMLSKKMGDVKEEDAVKNIVKLMHDHPIEENDENKNDEEVLKELIDKNVN